VPIQIKLPSTNGLKSLQFRVEVTPNGNGRPIPDQFRQLDMNPQTDFISVGLPSSTGQTATNNWVAYSSTNAGVITRGLEIFWLGTMANLAVNDFGTVTLVRVPMPPDGNAGDTYTISVVQPSGTSDALQSTVRLLPFQNRTITLSTNLTYVVGDSAVAFWYNAGDFGNGNLNNNDVNNAFYASLGIRTPYSFSDVFDAMDAFPVDTVGHVGGDGQIRYLDWQIILQRSLRLPEDPTRPTSTNNWLRRWDSTGRRAVVQTNLNALPDLPAEKQVLKASSASDFTQAWVGALPVENLKPGALARVPVYVRLAPLCSLKGLQFRVEVVAEGGAPALSQPAQFIANGSLPSPIARQGLEDGLPINQAISAWSLIQNPFAQALQASNYLGYVQFTVPAEAQTGQSYTVHVANADGSPDMTTQYSFETLPGTVWVGTTAQNAPETVSDTWKLKYFGSYTTPLAVATADPDGDGFTNAQEYSMGTDPNVPDWRFKLNLDNFDLRWFAATGKSYVVEQSRDLVNWSTVATFQGAGTVLDYSEAQNPEITQFYRVRETAGSQSSAQ
jgi:hypothetical protein